MKSYKLKIDNPCEQSWQEMKPGKDGKYCLHCSKTVIDFTHLNDGVILDIIKNSSGGICGRLKADQQNRELIQEKVNSSLRLTFSKIVASILLISLSEAGSAQSKKQEKVPAKQTASTKKNIPQKTGVNQHIATHSNDLVNHDSGFNGKDSAHAQQASEVIVSSSINKEYTGTISLEEVKMDSMGTKHVPPDNKLRATTAIFKNDIKQRKWWQFRRKL